jgi:hypothetical protein
MSTLWTHKLRGIQRRLHSVTEQLESQLQTITQAEEALRFGQTWLVPRSTPSNINNNLSIVENYLTQQSRQLSELRRITADLNHPLRSSALRSTCSPLDSPNCSRLVSRVPSRIPLNEGYPPQPFIPPFSNMSDHNLYYALAAYEEEEEEEPPSMTTENGQAIEYSQR